MLRDYLALHRYLAERSRMPFDWATNSCAHFAAGAIIAQTGRDPLATIPKWKSERGAKLVLARLGGMAAAVDSVLTRIPPAMAQRGDLAGVPTEDGGLLLMVVEGATLVGPDASGARRVARARMSIAWSAT